MSGEEARPIQHATMHDSASCIIAAAPVQFLEPKSRPDVHAIIHLSPSIRDGQVVLALRRPTEENYHLSSGLIAKTVVPFQAFSPALRRLCNMTQTFQTTWNGVDVVLLEETPPLGGGRDGRRKSISRARFLDDEEDHGWLRKMELRHDTPTIEEIKDWSFDPLEFEETVLVSVFIKMLDYYDFLEIFEIDRQVMRRYCLAVMKRHNKDCYYVVDDESITNEEKTDECLLCEYHNWYHAIACSQSCFMLLSEGEAGTCSFPVSCFAVVPARLIDDCPADKPYADRYLEKTEIFACLMGALIHDLDHPGTNNDFETKRETSLATQYDNDAVLERHSISQTFAMCEDDPELDWLSSFRDDKTRKHIQHFLTESVLATDPARHASIVKKALAHSCQACHFDRESVEDRLFICGLILHCADIANPSHPVFAVAADWAIRVTTEFSRQAKKERALGLDVADFMEGLDSQYKIAKLQIGFFRFMVKPLLQTVAKLFPNLSVLECFGDQNCDMYQDLINKIELAAAEETR